LALPFCIPSHVYEKLKVDATLFEVTCCMFALCFASREPSLPSYLFTLPGRLTEGDEPGQLPFLGLRRVKRFNCGIRGEIFVDNRVG